MRKRTRNENTGLLSRLSFPVFALIVAIIAFFATAASYILIRVQNDHTLEMANQSMKFVYRNIWYQFDTMNNVAAFILSNPSIEGLLESGGYQNTYDSVDDYFALQTNLENLSLVSLLNDFGSRSTAKKTYVVSIALEPGSGLYAMATDRFDPTTGIYKFEDLQGQEWYRSLSTGSRQSEWWGQAAGQSNVAMIYSARTKASIKDGRSIGTVIVGADTGSIRSVFENAQLKKGYHVLLDENDNVIFSERYDFLESVKDVPYVQALDGATGSMVARIDGEQHRVMFETFVNGWKLLTVVPESHFSQYTFAISAIGAATAIIALLIAGFTLRRIVVRVTVPITRLVSAMQRPEVLEFKEALPEQNSGIYEVDKLGERFASMLVTLHGLIEKSFSEEMERRQLQLELLHAQINPHFLYNTLDLINCRAIMAGDREASEIVRALANVFRYSLNKGETWISLGDEVKQIEAYLRIQQMMMDNLRVEIRVPEELLSSRIVHLTLQPLVENAIIHGFADRTSDCCITIDAKLKGKTLTLRVEDNGKGCDPARMNRMLREHQGSEPEAKAVGVRSGFGTLNVHRRIQLHCGEAFGLRYEETGEGTRVEIVVPYLQENRLPETEGLANV
ncbi:cache domain-containing sensor histidine kinase [Cohnella lupini]|uniref:Two-component system sensor histidine kinase YesM n=1 Tax=Cohnella lupini TaxID=1294267 RepID=A0A3D9ISV0_9BACL|nr:sensor histidine kinase [Cohnella lupini]RED64842.1 two-component system sensor histidine kinase YesM [Cohnella lupini]